MTEYAAFYRPGEVTLLLEPTETNPANVNVAVITAALTQLPARLRELGIALHDTPLAGNGGERSPAILENCHDIPHFVHTMNLASWISPAKQQQIDDQRSALQDRRKHNSRLTSVPATVEHGARLLWAKLTGPFRENEQQRALTDVLKVVEKINASASVDQLPPAPYRLIAATPNWLATPAQVT